MQKRTHGLTLIEVVIAAGLLSILLMGYMTAIGASGLQRQQAREMRIAHDALADFIQALRSQEIASLTTMTAGPVVPQLKDAVGTMRAVTSESPTASADLTDGDIAALGFPRDLNADGDTVDGPLAPGELVVLPVKVSLTWTSALTARRADNQRERMVLYVYLSDH